MMFGKKELLPEPKQQIEALKKELEDLEKAEKAEKIEKLKKKVPLPTYKEEPPALKEEPPELTNLELLEALNEHHVKMLNNFDRLYFKIDQTQDLIIQLQHNKEK